MLLLSKALYSVTERGVTEKTSPNQQIRKLFRTYYTYFRLNVSADKTENPSVRPKCDYFPVVV